MVSVQFLKKDNDITFIVLAKNNISACATQADFVFTSGSQCIHLEGWTLPSICLGKMEFVACDNASIHDILEEVSISSSIQCDGNGDSTTFSVRNQGWLYGTKLVNRSSLENRFPEWSRDKQEVINLPYLLDPS